MRLFNTSRAPRHFVSIGAGINQIPLIFEAKKLGFNVIGIDENGMAPGFRHCDLKIQESIDDHATILSKLEQLIINGRIHSIMTRSYGAAVRTACYLNAHYNLPSMPVESAELFLNKSKMKSRFLDCDIPTPRLISARGKQSISRVVENNLPIIVKPVAGHAKTGIRILRTKDDVDPALFRRRFSEHYIAEKFISGDELIASGIVHEKKFYLAHVSDKIKFDEFTFPDLAHVYPSVHADLIPRIEALGQQVADAFHIHTSPLIMEFVLDSGGNPLLIEAVPEFGGEFLVDILVPAATGFNFMKEAILASAGLSFTPPKTGRVRSSVRVQYIAADKENGRLQSFDTGGPPKTRGYLFHRVFKDIGSLVSLPSTNHDRIGVVIVKGPNRDLVSDRARVAVESLKMAITKG